MGYRVVADVANAHRRCGSPAARVNAIEGDARAGSARESAGRCVAAGRASSGVDSGDAAGCRRGRGDDRPRGVPALPSRCEGNRLLGVRARRPEAAKTPAGAQGRPEGSACRDGDGVHRPGCRAARRPGPALEPRPEPAEPRARGATRQAGRGLTRREALQARCALLRRGGRGREVSRPSRPVPSAHPVPGGGAEAAVVSRQRPVCAPGRLEERCQAPEARGDDRRSQGAEREDAALGDLGKGQAGLHEGVSEAAAGAGRPGGSPLAARGPPDEVRGRDPRRPDARRPASHGISPVAAAAYAGRAALVKLLLAHGADGRRPTTPASRRSSTLPPAANSISSSSCWR